MQKYEFLYSDDKKFVPIELKKINYGYAPIRGLLRPSEQRQIKSLDIVFPSYSQAWDTSIGGMIILLIKESEINATLGKLIHSVSILPLGENRTTIEIEDHNVGDRYAIYVISEKFKDGVIRPTGNNSWGINSLIGFIPTDLEFDDEDSYLITIPDDSSGGLELFPDKNSISQWYNWQGSYTSPDLIFFDCDANITNSEIQNSIDFFTEEEVGELRHDPAVGGGGAGVIPNYFISNTNGEETGIKIVTPDAQASILNMVPLYEVTTPGNSDPRRLMLDPPDNQYYTVEGTIGYVFSVDNPPLDAVAIYETINGNEGNNGQFLYGTQGGDNQSPVWYAYNVSQSPSGNEVAGSGAIQQTGMLAIMQNIRFLKNLMEDTNENIWGTITTTMAYMNTKLDDVSNTIKGFDDTNSIVSNISPRINDTMVTVEISELTTSGLNDWTNVMSFQTDPTHGIISINLNEYDTPGKYILSVKPPEFLIEIGSRTGDLFLIPQAFDQNSQIMGGDYNKDNFFYGWNIEFFNSTNGAQTPIGVAKKIVGSYHTSEGHTFKISPMPSGGIVYDENDLTARIWSDTFEPQTVSVDIVEHNAETLSYSLYGNRQMNRTSGIMVIYDHNGNVYKRLSMGTVSNSNTGGDIVDYRCDTENDFCFTGSTGA